MKPTLVFLTGAGISALAGIPTFEVLYNEIKKANDPLDLMLARMNSAAKQFLYHYRSTDLVTPYQPTELHKHIASLEDKYNVLIFTTNVDELHERAGSTKVYHIHGTSANPVYFGDEPYCLEEFNEAFASKETHIIIIGTSINTTYIHEAVADALWARSKKILLLDTNEKHLFKDWTIHRYDPNEFITNINNYLEIVTTHK